LIRQSKKERAFFEKLCADYYEKVLRYLFSALGSEGAARDCTQDVFLIACQKCALLSQHPNPGGFLFQTAKNLARKARREGYRQMISDIALDDLEGEPADHTASIDYILDRQLDEQQYMEYVLCKLTDEKRKLYMLYYLEKKSMAQIANLFGIEESAVRMRYVRLRREIREIASEVCEKYFTL